MHSIVGSYLKPPERVFVPSFIQSDESSQNHYSVNFGVSAVKMLPSPNSQGKVNIKPYLKLGEWYKVCYIKLHFYVENNVIEYLILKKITNFDSVAKNFYKIRQVI